MTGTLSEFVSRFSEALTAADGRRESGPVLSYPDDVDDLGPRLRQLTKTAQLDKKRFELEWVLPLELGLSTHVTLFDLECLPPHALAAGEGGDEAEALLDLWTTLRDHNDVADGLAHVAAVYHRRTGRQPEEDG